MKRLVVILGIALMLLSAGRAQAQCPRYYYHNSRCAVYYGHPHRAWVPGYWSWSVRLHRNIWIAGYWY